jgi:hypothetical protein
VLGELGEVGVVVSVGCLEDSCGAVAESGAGGVPLFGRAGGDGLKGGAALSGECVVVEGLPGEGEGAADAGGSVTPGVAAAGDRQCAGSRVVT